MSDPREIAPRSRPDRVRTLLNIARLLAEEQSTCLRKQVACLAVTVDLDQIVSMGVNGNERKGPNICRRPMERGNCGCQHAEANCLFKLRTSQDVVLVCTHSPCARCAAGITVVSNVRSVLCGEKFRDEEGLHILKKAGIEVRILEAR